jgi:hypothetical protein
MDADLRRKGGLTENVKFKRDVKDAPWGEGERNNLSLFACMPEPQHVDG